MSVLRRIENRVYSTYLHYELRTNGIIVYPNILTNNAGMSEISIVGCSFMGVSAMYADMRHIIHFGHSTFFVVQVFALIVL